MSTPTTFSEWVREERLRLGVTQERLAELVGKQRSYIVNVESGKKIALPHYETRVKFHRVFGTSEQDLINLGIVEGTPEPTPVGVDPEISEWRRQAHRIIDSTDDADVDFILRALRRLAMGGRADRAAAETPLPPPQAGTP